MDQPTATGQIEKGQQRVEAALALEGTLTNENSITEQNSFCRPREQCGKPHNQV
jgi:hypothetical protein